MNKIVFVHWGFPYGGAEMVTFEVANYLSSCDWDVSVISASYFASKFPLQKQIRFTLRSIPVYCMDKNLKSKWLADYLNRNNIDFLVFKDEVLFDLHYIRTHSKTKLIYHFHGIPYWEVIQKREEQLHSRHLSDRLCHRVKYALNESNTLLKMKEKQRPYYKYILDNVDAFVALCEGYKKILDEDTDYKYSGKIYPIYNSSFHPDVFPPDKRKEIIYVGRLTFPDKRVDRLINVWRKIQYTVPEWSLKIVGDGPEKANLESLSRRFKLERVSFTGWLKDVSECYSSASVVCLTSNNEGWPLAIADGQCYGAVPISFDVSDGVREIISGKCENGVLIPPFDLDSYSEQLLSLCQDEARLRKMQANVFEKSFDYTIQKTGKSWLEMLDALQKTNCEL